MQLLVTGSAGTFAGSRLENTTSRARCGTRALTTTMPNTSSSTDSGSSFCFSRRPLTECTERSSAERFLKTVPALANGVLAPPTMATRVAVFWCIAVLAPNALALSLRRFHGCRVLAAVDELFEPLLVKPDDEVVAMGDHGNAHAAAQSAPLS